MLNASNKNIALAIARAYCDDNTICQDSLFNRLNLFFDDSTFQSFLSTLSSRAYLVGGFQNLGTMPGGAVKIKFVYFDVISGGSGSGIKIVPAILFEQNRFDEILKGFDQNLFFVKQNSDNSTLFYNASQGYNIAYTTDPTSGGETGGGNPGDGGTTGGGGIIIKTPVNYLDPPAQTPVENVFKGFDYQSLLIPGTVLVGLYFLMNSKK